MRHNWRASLKKFGFSQLALSVIFLLVYAKCNFAAVLKVSDQSHTTPAFIEIHNLVSLSPLNFVLQWLFTLASLQALVY